MAGSPVQRATILLACLVPAAIAGDVPLDANSVAPDVQDILFLGPARPVLLRLHITIDGQPFRQAWHERFDEMFALEDRDGDGRLTLDEARIVARDMNGGLGASAKNLKEFVSGETIDRQALAAYVEQTFPPFVLRPRQVIGQGAALALFPLLDTNGDQRLTAGELAVAEAQLLQRDFDDNGVMTPGELILDPKAIAAAADPNASEADLDPDDSPVLVVDAALTGSRFAERMLKQYDRNHDSRLATDGTALEIKLPRSVAGRWDTDGDGTLAREELERAELWSPDLELPFAMGHASVRAVRRGRSPRSPEGFRVRKKLLGGYHLELGEATIELNRHNRDPRQADLVQMRNYDRDNNEYLDKAEAGANNISPDTFTAMDIDGDGKVFKGELTSFMTRQNAAAAARLYLVVKDKGQNLFDVMEIDTDGLLSPRELRSARNVLDIHDENGDGVLGGDEVPQQLMLELVRGVDERVGPETFVHYTTLASQSRSPSSGPLWFRKMDRNNDGDLSPAEFIGPRAKFDRLDADGDGLVDRDEAEAAGGRE